MFKKIFFLFSLIIITSFTNQRASDLLNETDYLIAEHGNNAPALSIPSKDGSWIYSYNKWICFPAEFLEISKSKVNYDGWKELPNLNTTFNNENILIFDLDHDENWDTNSILLHWSEELSKSQDVCIFAAYLESNENEHIYFIEKIKFENSYWNRSEELNRINDVEMED